MSDARDIRRLTEAVRLLCTAVEALASKVDRLAAGLPPVLAVVRDDEPRAPEPEPEAPLVRWTEERQALACRLVEASAAGARPDFIGIAAAVSQLRGPPVSAELVERLYRTERKRLLPPAAPTAPATPPAPAPEPARNPRRWPRDLVEEVCRRWGMGEAPAVIGAALGISPKAACNIAFRNGASRPEGHPRRAPRKPVMQQPPAPAPEAPRRETVAEAIKAGREDVYVPGPDQRVPTARPGSAGLAPPRAAQQARRVTGMLLDTAPAELRAEAVAQAFAPADADTILAWGRRQGAVHAQLSPQALADINDLRAREHLTPFRLVTHPLGRIPQHELDRMAGAAAVPEAAPAPPGQGLRNHSAGIYGAPAPR